MLDLKSGGPKSNSGPTHTPRLPSANPIKYTHPHVSVNLRASGSQNFRVRSKEKAKKPKRRWRKS